MAMRIMTLQGGKPYVGRLLGLLFLAGTAVPAFAQLDETWTVTVAGQTVQVNPDGSFAIPNVAAPDLFGPGGPGRRRLWGLDHWKMPGGMFSPTLKASIWGITATFYSGRRRMK